MKKPVKNVLPAAGILSAGIFAEDRGGSASFNRRLKDFHQRMLPFRQPVCYNGSIKEKGSFRDAKAMVRIMDQTIFAGRLKELRKKKGMSQEQLADAVGLSVQAVSKWECALSYPDITLLPVLSRLFGVSVDALLCGSSGGEMPLNGLPAASLPFEDDGVLRIVQFRGRTLLQRDTYSPETEISLALDGAEFVRIEVWGSVNIKGDVNGDVSSNVSATCGDVSGDITANGAVTCGEVGGDVTANGAVTCGDVDGDITTEGSVSCQTVKGDIEASGDVHVNGGLKS